MKAITNFIIIDDERINNFMSSMIIEDAYDCAAINAFTDPEKGLEYLAGLESSEMEEMVLYLDINMPRLNGWQFMERYQQFSEKLKEKIKVFILTSSIDDREKVRACNTPNVIDCLEKPLSQEIVIATTTILDLK
jgi:response regulator RpfG family c-di-GMP phosphodiesterase